MKLKFGFVAAAAAAALLAGCGGNYYGGGGVGVNAGYVGPVALDDCGGYYDDFYGPIDDGCWADDGAFWYRGHGESGWHRDAGGHFGHAAAGNMHEMHPTGPGHGYHFGGGAHAVGGGEHHE
jgi:hypothetical protein